MLDELVAYDIMFPMASQPLHPVPIDKDMSIPPWYLCEFHATVDKPVIM